jgi:hypothetical protein
VVDAGGPVHHLVRRVAHLHGMGSAGDGDGARALGFGSAIRTKNGAGILTKTLDNPLAKRGAVG